jgi:hypothetical protein
MTSLEVIRASAGFSSAPLIGCSLVTVRYRVQPRVVAHEWPVGSGVRFCQ